MSGELRCIIGPNGAGKSTLFALLCGIHRPDAGILFKGQDVTRLSAFRRVRLGVGLTFQTNRAYHHLSVRQNLEMPMHRPGRMCKGPQERYASCAGNFGLDPMSDIRAGELPHDKLQWLEIAMVLAGGPTFCCSTSRLPDFRRKRRAKRRGFCGISMRPDLLLWLSSTISRSSVRLRAK